MWITPDLSTILRHEKNKNLTNVLEYDTKIKYIQAIGAEDSGRFFVFNNGVDATQFKETFL